MKKKRKPSDIIEELDAMGQENEHKAAKWVIEKGNEDRHVEDEKTAEETWKLHDNRQRVWSYKDALLSAMKRRMIEFYNMLPENFAWYPLKSDKGIVLWFRDPKGQWYARGMYISLEPKYDLNCVERLVNKALDEMDKIEQEYAKPQVKEDKLII